MEINLPTCGQLERDLSQGIQKLYLKELEHSPGKIICQLFGNQLAIVVEDSLTAVEQILVESGDCDRAIQELNTTISEAVKTKIRVLIEEILAVEVKDLLFDTTLKTKRTGAIATLSQLPKVRNPESIPKNRGAKHNR